MAVTAAPVSATPTSGGRSRLPAAEGLRPVAGDGPVFDPVRPDAAERAFPVSRAHRFGFAGVLAGAAGVAARCRTTRGPDRRGGGTPLFCPVP